MSIAWTFRTKVYATPTKDYRDNFDAIFGKVKDDTQDHQGLSEGLSLQAGRGAGEAHSQCDGSAVQHHCGLQDSDSSPSGSSLDGDSAIYETSDRGDESDRHA